MLLNRSPVYIVTQEFDLKNYFFGVNQQFANPT